MLLTRKEWGTPANKITFEVIAVHNLKTNSKGKAKKPLYMDGIGLKKLIDANAKFYLYNQKCVLTSGHMKLTLRVHTVPQKYMENVGKQILRPWIIDDKTKVDFKTQLSNISFVDSSSHYPLTSLQIELITPSNDSVLSILFGKQQEIEEFPEQKLLEQIRAFFQSGVVNEREYDFEFVSEKDKKIPLKLKVVSMKTDSPSLPKCEYGFMGQLNEKTDIKLKYDPSKINLQTEDKEIDLKSKDPLEHLQELGMGGPFGTFSKDYPERIAHSFSTESRSH